MAFKAQSFTLVTTFALICAGCGRKTPSAPLDDSAVHPRIQFELDHSNLQFPEGPIPTEEKPFTSDVRRVIIDGVRLDKPVIVTGENEAAIPEAFKPISRYLRLAKQHDVSAVLPLYDDESAAYIKSLPKETSTRVLEHDSSLQGYEFHLVTWMAGYTIVYGNEIRDGKTVPGATRLRVRKVGSDYKMCGGLPNFSMKYDLLLNVVLRGSGYSGVKNLDSPK